MRERFCSTSGLLWDGRKAEEAGDLACSPRMQKIPRQVLLRQVRR